jgi:hypothetical protein
VISFAVVVLILQQGVNSSAIGYNRYETDLIGELQFSVHFKR